MSRLYVCMYALHNLDMIYKNIALTNPWYYIIGWCKLAEMWWKNNKGRVWGEIMEWGWVCHPLKLTMWEKSIITPLQKTVVGGCVGSLQCYISRTSTLIYSSLTLSPANPTALPGTWRAGSQNFLLTALSIDHFLCPSRRASRDI